MRRLTCLLLALAVSGCATAPAGKDLSSAGTAARAFASLGEAHAAMETVIRGGDADPFWSRVLAHRVMPLVFGEQALFLWRGEAGSVEWRGDFSSWSPSVAASGRRLGTSKVWVYERQFPLDARLDYKLVIDGTTWLVDPLNPHQQSGGSGPNSEVRMPAWRVPANGIRREGIARGILSDDLAIVSAELGYVVNYRVYVPARFERSTSKNLPVLYVTDGSDYWNDEMGSLVITLDNLIARRRIVPIVAVFIDPWDRPKKGNRRQQELIPAADRSCPFCEFVVRELVPAIDNAYPTWKDREGRAILGTSLGGLHATLMATRYASTFGMAGIQSPAYQPAPWVLESVGSAERLPLKTFINAGTFEPEVAENARRLRVMLESRHAVVKQLEVHQGHSWGQWRALLDDMLRFFYGSEPG